MPPDTRTFGVFLTLLLLVAPGFVLAEPAPTAPAPPPKVNTAPHLEQLRLEVVNVYPHDPDAFTQGLLLRDGVLFESTGLEGRSTLREVDLTTGTVKRRLDLAPAYFGEGLALAGDRLVQLTWQSHVAFVYDPASFKQLGQFTYDTEGWGLCFDGQRLILSDGSERLYLHDPHTFASLGTVTVTLNGQPLRHLNELECVHGQVYANLWRTNSIVRIDPQSGVVTAVVDASGLLTPTEQRRADVLNGIAYDPARDTFYLTGKLWPKLFAVRFVPTN